MLSRVAESIYWMSRYVERAENVARFISVNLNLMLDNPTPGSQQWLPLINVTGDGPGFEKKYGTATQANVVRFLALDADYPNSIVSCLGRARDNARSIRETISSETWEQLNEFEGFVREAARTRQALDDPHEFFDHVRLAGHLFQGIIDATMSHNQGWHFARMGRMLERADKTSRLLDVKYFILLPSVQDVDSPIDDLQWSAVLQSVSAFEMYRKRFHGITPRRVVEFLLLDGDFPRAIMHCVRAADSSLHAITGTSRGTFSNRAEQRLGQLQSDLAFAGVEEVVQAGLHQFIDALQVKLNEVDDAVYDTFFAMDPSSQALRATNGARQPQDQLQ